MELALQDGSEMEPWAGLLRALTTVLFLGLAATSFVRARQRRDAPATWAAVSFVLLAAVTTVGALLPHSGGGAVEWGRKALVAAVVAFPYCLHRFAAAFKGAAGLIGTAAAVATALLVAVTLALPPFPQPGGATPVWLSWYIGGVLALWTTLSLQVAVTLWSSGGGQSGVVRRRMRLLAYASVGLSAAVLMAGATRAGPSAWPTLVVQALTLGSTTLFWAGLTPPRFLLASWRQPDEAHLNQALQSLVAATRRDEIADVLLPHLVRVVGGRAAAFFDDEGRVLAHYGHSSDVSVQAGSEDAGDGAGSAGRVDFPLGSGRLSIWVGPYTPFFGADELERVRSLTSLLDLAWERIRLAESERETQQALDRERDFSRRLVHSASDCILAFDEQYRYTLWNPAMERMTGIPASEVLGRVAFERFPSMVESGGDEFMRAALAGESVVVPEHYFDVPETGVRGWFTVSYAPLRDEGGVVVGGLSVSHDVTPAKEAERLRREALHDPLTGLPNRTLFFEGLEHALTRLERHAGAVAVMFIDVDNFKQINDRLGHQVGDQVLRGLAARLTETLRPEDTVARLGGDEIAVFCEDVVDAAHATAIGQRIVDAFAAPLRLRDQQLTVTVSVGITLAAHPADPQQLVREADAAMYQAKRNGRGRAELYCTDSLQLWEVTAAASEDRGPEKAPDRAPDGCPPAEGGDASPWLDRHSQRTAAAPSMGA